VASNPDNISGPVRGYIKPDNAFFTLDEWEDLAWHLISLQRIGIDTRGGEFSCKKATFCSDYDLTKFIQTVSKYFGYLLTDEVDRWDLLTRKNILDFIEDFVNHRVWGIEKEFSHYFPNIRSLRIGYFYSRGDIEPYVLLDEEFTRQVYGSNRNPVRVYHFTSYEGLARLSSAIDSGKVFDISAFTKASRSFFRSKSILAVEIEANGRAAFRSDIKSYAVDSGRRACNMYRLGYPGKENNNLCLDFSECVDDTTDLWNEFIVTPEKIIHVKPAENHKSSLNL